MGQNNNFKRITNHLTKETKIMMDYTSLTMAQQFIRDQELSLIINDVEKSSSDDLDRKLLDIMEDRIDNLKQYDKGWNQMISINLANHYWLAYYFGHVGYAKLMDAIEITEAQLLMQEAQEKGSVNLFYSSDLVTLHTIIIRIKDLDECDPFKHIDYTTSDFWIHSDTGVLPCANAEHLAYYIKTYGPNNNFRRIADE
jgi:hypothetical protein